MMFALTTIGSIGFSPDRYRTKEISAKDGKDFIAVQGKLEFDEAFQGKLNTVSSCFPQPPWHHHGSKYMATLRVIRFL